MYGLHIEGNVEGYYVNTRGFIVNKDECNVFIFISVYKLRGGDYQCETMIEIDEQDLNK